MKRFRREKRRLLLLQGLSLQQEQLLGRLAQQLPPGLFLELPSMGVHPHLVENNRQGTKPPVPRSLGVPQLEEPLPQPDPLLLTDRELTLPPEPEEPMPPVQLELAQRLGLPLPLS